MKLLFSFFIGLILISNARAQNVGIGTTTPSPAAMLDISSTQKGLLPPRMTIAQRTAIVSPVAGLIIWCIDCGQLQVYDGAVWQNIAGAIATLPSINICGLEWMTKNLDVKMYRNGDPIPQVTTNVEWDNLTTGAWCWYNNDSTTYAATYGRLYNFYAVADPRGLAPEGWHVPSVAEWATLLDCLGPISVAGGAMKEAGTTHWLSPNTGATNSSGFTGLPGGFRNWNNGLFVFLGSNGGWWTTYAGGIIDAADRELSNTSANLMYDEDLKRMGFSVRCIRN